LNTGFDKAKANAVLAAGNADLVAFGVPFIGNPDLPERLRRDAPYNKPNRLFLRTRCCGLHGLPRTNRLTQPNSKEHRDVTNRYSS